MPLTDFAKRMYCAIFQNSRYLLIPKMHNELAIRRCFYKERFSPAMRFKGLFDYARFRTLEMLAIEIQERKLPGNLAELGVYQGGFSAAMNALAPERTLYLFDTFSGFTSDQIEHERINGYSTVFSDESFVDTSVQRVLTAMPHSEKCIVKAGLFPDSLDGLEDAFALVSLDADMYQPTYDGLRYFYPRLVPGGYIMIHDYNDPDCPGVRKAVADYEAEFGMLCKTPISDRFGSVVISKVT